MISNSRMTQRLLTVSNRLPIKVEKIKGNLHFQPSIGGLATGIGSVHRSYDALWIGWPGISLDEIREEEKEEIEERLMLENCYPVFISQSDANKFYYGFCNKTLWPLFHYFVQYVSYNKVLWDAYKRVNELFCESVIKIANEDDIIWIHDYHLMLLPRLIRERLPDATIGFFLHIPFPSFEAFRLVPWRREILSGILGADLIGFHIYDYVQHFLITVHRLLGYEDSFGQINLGDRIIKVDAFPMGIDYERFSNAMQERKVREEVRKLRKKLGTQKIILSTDRLDYTKGIPQRLKAFNTFLETNPAYKGQVTFILVTVPSRIEVEQYKLLKRQVDELVGRIIGKHGTIYWAPIQYISHYLPFHTLVALYSIADIALITPLRDGMNLMVKEYIATKTDGRGVLILSEMAGAARELGEAIIINPNNEREIVEALERALRMPEEEQLEINRAMQNRLQQNNINRWAEEFIDALLYTKELQKEVGAKVLTEEMRSEVVRNYHKSNRRLIVTDYDGTLIPFSDKPERARPDKELLDLLKELNEDRKTELVIISGRDKRTLERWFGGLGVGLVAEHGVWIKEQGREWEMIEPLRNDWKEEIRPVLESYVDTTPGSFTEEKDFSLVWHYRRTDPELGSVRAREIRDILLNLTANLDLQVLEGSKVIEVKNAGINKGHAALRWISRDEWDFILAIGDDWTDEDIFSVLPEGAYSIKVGLGPSKAKFNLSSVGEVRSMLRELIDRCE